MEILFLGTGGCTPSTRKPIRTFAGFYIQAKDQGLLFDIGPGTCVKLVQSGIDINALPTHIFISHLHPDHSADFVGLMQGRGLNHAWSGYKGVTKIFGGEGIKEFVDQIFTGVTAWKSFSDMLKTEEVIDVLEVGEGVICEEDSWKVSATPVEHFNSRAFKFEMEGKTIVYTGDMGYDERFSQFGKDADLAIMECSFPDRKTLKGTHLCPEDIGRLAQLGNFKQIALTHMYPECEGRENEMVAKIHEFTNADVVVAHDLLKINL